VFNVLVLLQLEEAIAAKTRELSETKAQENTDEQERKRTSDRVQQLERQLEQAQAGVATGGDGRVQGDNLQEQIREAKRQQIAAHSEQQSAALRVKHNKSELSAKSKQTQKASAEFTRMESERAELSAKLNKLKNSLQQVEYDEEQESALLKQKKIIERSIQAVKEVRTEKYIYICRPTTRN
jgi:chromosome segregation ATPase